MAKVASSFKALVLEHIPHFWSDYKDGEYTLQVQLGSGIETPNTTSQIEKMLNIFLHTLKYLIKGTTSYIILISLF